MLSKLFGVFEQTPASHLKGSGCPRCKNSKGENKIYNYLNDKKIVFETQKSFVGCRNINPLFFDFYLPKYNMCIEYDGIQHFKSIERFGGVSEFDNCRIRDNIKNNYCKDNNIKLLRIKYDEHIIEKLKMKIFL